jgi:hypothetical protein
MNTENGIRFINNKLKLNIEKINLSEIVTFLKKSFENKNTKILIFNNFKLFINLIINNIKNKNINNVNSFLKNYSKIVDLYSLLINDILIYINNLKESCNLFEIELNQIKILIIKIKNKKESDLKEKIIKKNELIKQIENINQEITDSSKIINNIQIIYKNYFLLIEDKIINKNKKVKINNKQYIKDFNRSTKIINFKNGQIITESHKPENKYKSVYANNIEYSLLSEKIRKIKENINRMRKIEYKRFLIRKNTKKYENNFNREQRKSWRNRIYKLIPKISYFQVKNKPPNKPQPFKSSLKTSSKYS